MGVRVGVQSGVSIVINAIRLATGIDGIPSKVVENGSCGSRFDLPAIIE